jgi:ABC-type antimicrobial peptide transport system permease subunit
MATMVRQRRRELALRHALGATPLALNRLVLRRGLAIAMIGSGVGLAGALLVNGLLRTVLYEVSPTDIPTLGMVAGSLLGVAALATFIPARSASRVDPAVALRADG